MRLLIIGAGSYLGGHLRRQAAAAGCSVTTAGRSGLAGGHYRLDLVADGVDRVADVVAAAGPDVVINCAGIRNNQRGALLSPRNPFDGDLLGVRLPRSVTNGPVTPGRALVHRGDGEFLTLQVPRLGE